LKQYLQDIFLLLGEDRRKLPGLVLLFLVSSLLDLMGIGLIGPYIALVIDPRELDGRLGDVIAALGLPRELQAALILIGMGLLGVFLLKAITAIWVQRSILRFSQNQLVRLQSTLMRSYQALPYTEFLQRNSSEYVHAIGHLVGSYSTVVQIGLRTVSDSIVATAILGLLAWQNLPALALLTALLLTVILGYDRLFRRRLAHYGQQANKGYRRMYRGVHEGIEGLKEIRILGKEEHFYRMVHEGARENARFSTRAQVISLAPRYLLELTLVAFVVTLVLLMLLMGHNLQALVPTLGMFGLAALRLMPSANTLSSSLINLRYYRDSVSRLYRDQQAVANPLREARKPPVAIATDEFRSLSMAQVQFTYPNAQQPALQDLSLKIHAGESIGLIGPSGSGKTTLVDVLLGLLEPQAGEIRYNDEPLREALAAWRAQVAYLPQQVFLIDDTLRRNVALGLADEEIDDNRLTEALRQARLADLVSELPDGAATIIGERGIRLSGGQRQRVALARAFYHNRNILVMDEATSALDNETEREIIEEIWVLKGTKTLVVIAHRLTTLQHCDRIYRLKKGRIVELGTYEEAMQQAPGAPNLHGRHPSAPQSGGELRLDYARQ
jgi:ABC-type multidrug transport system fused ATPase/permease subunit